MTNDLTSHKTWEYISALCEEVIKSFPYILFIMLLGMKCDIDSSKTWIILIRNLISIDSNILVLSGDIYKAFLICTMDVRYSGSIYGYKEIKLKYRVNTSCARDFLLSFDFDLIIELILDFIIFS